MTLKDAYGNSNPVAPLPPSLPAITDVAFSQTLIASGTVSFGTITYDSSSETYSVPVTGVTTGTLDLGATISSVAVSGTPLVTVTPANANHLVFTQTPAGTTDTLSTQPQISTEDPSGNVTGSGSSGHTITLTPFSSNNCASGTNLSTSLISSNTHSVSAGGIATFSGVVIKSIAVQSIQATDSGSLTSACVAVTVTSGTATQLAFVAPPSGRSVDSALGNLTVQAQDANGNATGSTATVTLFLSSSSTCVLAGLENSPNNTAGLFDGSGAPTPTALNASTGRATFNAISATKTGNSYVCAISSPVLTPANFAVTMTPGAMSAAASSLSATSPIASGATSTITVTPKDQFGNTSPSSGIGAISYASDTASVMANPSGAGLSTTGLGALAGTAHLSATMGASTIGGSGNSVSVVVQAGNIAKITYTAAPTAGASVDSVLPSSVSFAVTDADGNTVSSYTGSVTLAFYTSNDCSSGLVSQGSNTYAAVTPVTNSPTGTFTNVWPKSTAIRSIKVTDGGILTYSCQAISLSPGAYSLSHSLITLNNSTVNSGATVTATVVPKDQFDNFNPSGSYTPVQVYQTPVTGGTVTPSTVTGTLGSVSGNTVYTATLTGLHSGNLTVGANLTVSASLTPITSTAASLTVNAATATQLVFHTQPTNTVAGSSISPAVVVYAEDANGNIDTTYTSAVTLAIGTNPGSGTLSGSAGSSSAGIATASNLSINKVGTGYTLTASSGSLTSATSSTFNITPAAATQLVFNVQPSNAVAAASISPAVVVYAEDANGNIDTNYTTAVTLAIGTNPSSGTLSGAPGSTSAGTSTASNLSIDKAGNGYTLTATSGSLPSKTSSSFNITGGSATQLVFHTQPTNAVAGSSISPSVVVYAEDANGNIDPNYTTAVTLAIGTNPGSGTLSGSAGSTSAGIATASNLSINKVGTGYTLVASSGSLTSATSSTFNITPAAATQLVFNVQPSDAVAAASISPAVVVYAKDANGNIDTNYTTAVTLAIGTNPSSGTLSGAPGSTSAGTSSASNLSINKAGKDLRVQALLLDLAQPQEIAETRITAVQVLAAAQAQMVQTDERSSLGRSNRHFTYFIDPYAFLIY